MTDLNRALYIICSELYHAQGEWEDHYPEDGEAGEVWEQACTTVLLLHGRPPPHPGYRFDERANRQQYMKRNDWIMQLEHTLTGRFRLHPGQFGPFIAAYEKWCNIHAEAIEGRTP